MVSVSSIFQASIAGSVQFLVLNGSGALLAYLGLWNDSMATNLSSAVFKVFMSALVFGPVMETAYSLRNTLTSGAYHPAVLQDILVPFTFSVFLSSTTAIVFMMIVILIGRGKHPLVKALMWATLMLGNTTTLPVVILQALCNVLPALSAHNPQCLTDVTTYSAIFLIPQIVLTWAITFPMLQSTVHGGDFDSIGEDSSLLPTSTTNQSDTDVPNPPRPPSTSSSSSSSSSSRISWSFFASKVVNPPVITILIAAVLGLMPIIPQLFIGEQAPLRSIISSLDSLGMLAVYLSAIVVGAEVLECLKPQSSQQPILHVQSTYKKERSFGTFAILCITIIRLIIFPWIGRLFYNGLQMKSWFYKDILGLFVMEQTNLTTSSSVILMVTMLRKHCSFVNVLQKDIAIMLFLQLVIAPVFLTLNTSLSIALQYM